MANDLSHQLSSLVYSIADQNFQRTKSLGILNLSLNLAEALAARAEFQRFEVFSNSSLRDWQDRFSGRPVRYFERASDSGAGRMLWDQIQVYAEASKQGSEWLLLPKGFASFCRRPRVKLAAYVHDTIGEHYQQRYPGAVSRVEAWYFRRSLLATLRQAVVIFTNSEFTRRELLALTERHAFRSPDIVVAGIGFRPVRTPAPLERNEVLVLASPLPHKRTDLAVRFMSAWQSSSRYTGRVHWIGRFPAGLTCPTYPNWKYHERLDQPAYQSLLAASRAVVYFSEYEGFGMPPVEAVLAGACPVYSSIPATIETMGGAGAPFDNDSADSFADAMRIAVQMSPAQLNTVAESLLARHNWPQVADRIVGALSAHSRAA